MVSFTSIAIFKFSWHKNQNGGRLMIGKNLREIRFAPFGMRGAKIFNICVSFFDYAFIFTFSEGSLNCDIVFI